MCINLPYLFTAINIENSVISLDGIINNNKK